VIKGLFVRGSAGIVGLVGMCSRSLHDGNLHTYVYWFLAGLILLWAVASGLL
jgi:NADH-quinone oxidoreductase subunit L